MDQQNKNGLQGYLQAIQQDTQKLLKLPSRLEEAERRAYKTLLHAILHERCLTPDTEALLSEFLAKFETDLKRCCQAVTWEYNGEWFAARAGDNAGPRKPHSSEEEALEALYEVYPDLR